MKGASDLCSGGESGDAESARERGTRPGEARSFHRLRAVGTCPWRPLSLSAPPLPASTTPRRAGSVPEGPRPGDLGAFSSSLFCPPASFLNK